MLRPSVVLNHSCTCPYFYYFYVSVLFKFCFARVQKVAFRVSVYFLNIYFTTMGIEGALNMHLTALEVCPPPLSPPAPGERHYNLSTRLSMRVFPFCTDFSLIWCRPSDFFLSELRVRSQSLNSSWISFFLSFLRGYLFQGSCGCQIIL